MDPVVGTSAAARPGAGVVAIRTAIADACRRANRAVDSVTLVAASKTVPPETLELAITGGLDVFGENRVQETVEKWTSLRASYPHISLHLIGPLQSNKARDAVALCDVIHSVDRPSLCRALARQSAEQGRRPKMFIQVNTGREPQKAGIAPEDLDAFVESCRRDHDLDVVGLMCIPPAEQPPEKDFEMLAEMAARNGLPCLSMGMSGDFALAIEYGATHVRVGRALFGARS